MPYFDEIPFDKLRDYTRLYDRETLYVNSYQEKLIKEGGHLGNPDTAMFYELCFHARDPIVELGSGGMGDGGYLIGKAIRHGGYGTHFYTVDTTEHLAVQAAKRAVMAAPNLLAVPVVSKSWNAPTVIKEEPGLVFVDASHAEKDVAMDIRAWKDLILPGGFLVFHDLWSTRNDNPDWPDYGVKQAVEKELLNDPKWAYVQAARFTGVFQRRGMEAPDDPGTTERVEKRATADT